MKAAGEDQHLVIVRVEKFDRAPSERLVIFSKQNQPFHPPEKRARVLLVRFHVDRFIVVFRVDDHREIKPLRVGAGKTGVAVRAPLHRRAHAVAVAEINIVAHADLIAVVDHRGSRQRKEEAVEQFHFSAIIVQQRSQAPANAQIKPRAWVVGIYFVHVVAIFIGHHFQR